MNFKDQAIKDRLDSGKWIVDPDAGIVLSTITRGGKPGMVPRKIGCQAKHPAHNYMVAGMVVSGKRVQIRLHRVIWIACRGDIPEGLEVDHINGIRTDNRIANLRLVTAVGNKANSIRLGMDAFGERNGQAKLQATEVSAIRAMLGTGLTQDAIGAQFHVSRQTVSAIKRQENWKRL